ncbi:helix-turn-helix domain-containing protein [Dietzia cinnamea]|uniref:helix-turn-helix domain-containing protein n=1 Tax=Dietzia cinnamea TaxID=321318 RepID=UPI0021A7B868|nr:helix-turn-helix domain-containing protein [Dietzia cinnamea]MCT1639460.1 transcriptional regulator [Dietzia cinnamea]
MIVPRTAHPSPSPDTDPLDLAWRRSELSGLTPQSARPGAPDPRAARSHRLTEAARPVMDGLDTVLRDTGASLVLADREGRVIRTARDNARISRMLLRRGVDDGATLTEEAVGNNGIGTALETRAGVFIHGEQHFAEVLRDFVCYGHPIIDPLTRRLVGAVNLTGMSADASRLFAPFVRKVVADIEARYVDTARADDRELWRRFVERTRSSDTATCAFGDEVVLASHSSLERLDSRDLVTLRRLVERDEMGEVVELSVGTVGVATSRVGRRGHLLDLTFPESPGAPTPAPRTISAAPVTRVIPLASAGPAEAAPTQGETTEGGPTAGTPTSAAPSAGTPPVRTPLAGAPTVVRSHAVRGPSGSGRSTTARAIAGPGARHLRLAEADDAATAWREMVAPALRERSGPVILDDIDLLDDADLRRLAARMESAGEHLVVVTSRDDPRPAVTAILDLCDRRTEVRPLHERGTEGEGIVRRMVADLAARRGMRPPTVTSRFVEAACVLDLPNGLVTLRSILGDCLTRLQEKGSVSLDVDALPSRSRSARPPRPGELARGEYDAIVAALTECGGVRSRAARRLGISRTTLYARMREFGLS